MTTTILCFYHYPCNDGSAAAAALRHRLESAGYRDGDVDIRFCPVTYKGEWDDPFPEHYLENEVVPSHPVREIFIVDVTLSPTKFNQLADHLQSTERLAEGPLAVVCIDHHETARVRIAELERYCTETYIRIGPGLSGATLVWNYFNERFGEELPTPELLRYVADQDIWEWKLPDSKEINAALNTLDGSVATMEEELKECLADERAWREGRKAQGSAIVSMVDSQVIRSSRQVVKVPVDDVTLLVVNSTAFTSELGNHLCNESEEESPDVLAVIYSIQEDWSVRCSIRSIPGGKSTARQFAERYDGGGHDHAAGCRFDDYETFRAELDRLNENGW
jgi:hypothetical protein